MSGSHIVDMILPEELWEENPPVTHHSEAVSLSHRIPQGLVQQTSPPTRLQVQEQVVHAFSPGCGDLALLEALNATVPPTIYNRF